MTWKYGEIHSCSQFCERPECVKARESRNAAATSTREALISRIDEALSAGLRWGPTMPDLLRDVRAALTGDLK